MRAGKFNLPRCIETDAAALDIGKCNVGENVGIQYRYTEKNGHILRLFSIGISKFSTFQPRPISSHIYETNINLGKVIENDIYIPIDN